MTQHKKADARPRSVDDLPSKGQPRDHESLGDHSLARTDRDRPMGTGDRNKGMLHG